MSIMGWKSNRDHASYVRKRYSEDPVFAQKLKDRNHIWETKNKEKIRLLISGFRSNGCSLCPEKSDPCLVAHHLDPKEKSFTLGDASRAKTMSANRIMKELQKCICLCMNCHAKFHAGLLTI